MRQTVTRLRAARTTDPYTGEATRPDWSNPARLVIGGVSLQPQPGDEDTDRAQITITRWSLEAVGWPDLREDDRIEWAGHVWDVTDVARWHARKKLTSATIYRQEG